MTVYRLNMTLGTGQDARDVAVEVEANSPDEAVAALGTRGVRVNEHGATYVSPLSADVAGGTVYNEWKVNQVTASKAKVTTEFAARQLAEMREKVQAAPDHGITQAQAEDLLDGMTAEQIREVAARGPMPAGYQQKSKTDLVRHTVSMTVGSALQHRAIVGYPEKGIPAEWTRSEDRDRRRSAMVADTAPAVRWKDPKTGIVHVGVVRGRSSDAGTADIEWDHGRIERGVPYQNRDGVVFLPEDHPETARAHAEATQRAEARAAENDRRAGTSFAPVPDPNDQPADPFGGDTSRKRGTEARIRAAIAANLNDGRKTASVSMIELREALPDLPREEFDAAAENVFRHSDVWVDPLRSQRDNFNAHFEQASSEELDAGLKFGGTNVMTVRMDDRGRNLLEDRQRWRAADRDAAHSYFNTCDEHHLRRLAREFGLDDDGDADTLRERLAGHAARNQREDTIRRHQEQEDLTVLYEAEQADTNPAAWTPEERQEVAAAAQRQKDNQWAPGAARAAKFTDLPLDGSVPPDRQAAYEKEQADKQAAEAAAEQARGPQLNFADRVEALKPYTEFGPGYVRGVADYLHTATQLAQVGSHDEAAHWLTEAEREAERHDAKKSQADQAAQDYTRRGGTLAGLEMTYDQIKQAHERMADGLAEQTEARIAVAEHLTDAETAVYDMERGTARLREIAERLFAEMEAAGFDATSLEGVSEAVEALDADLVQELCDKVDIGRDYAHDGAERVNAAAEAVYRSMQHVETTYGALAAGVQETGIAGSVLNSSGDGRD